MAKKEFIHPLVELMKGNEEFTRCSSRKFGIFDFWRYMYSNIYENTGDIAEFLVAMALGKTESFKKYGWTQYDLDYEGLRIEVKATQYYQPWRADNRVSETRKFGIPKTLTIEGNRNSPKARNNDIYVFCLNKGRTYNTSNPLKIENWLFWVIPTKIINEECGEQKNISLQKVKSLSKIEEGVTFENLRTTIDNVEKENKELLWKK